MEGKFAAQIDDRGQFMSGVVGSNANRTSRSGTGPVNLVWATPWHRNDGLRRIAERRITVTESSGSPESVCAVTIL